MASTSAAAEAACLDDADPEALAAGRRAATAAIAAGRPVVASAALDRVCAAHLVHGEYSAALASVAERGAVLDRQTVDATTAYAFNDYLFMGCEVSLAAGDLSGAATFADRLVRLSCHRTYVPPAPARRLEVHVLAGDLDGALAHGDRFRESWGRAGLHRASTLSVAACALALAHGLLGHRADREEWQGGSLKSWSPVARSHSPATRRAGHRRSTPGCCSTAAAVDRLAADLDAPLWRTWNTAL